jgi:pyruvate dehydrogenase E2 component (dihydrolipoamide acetyltransferase)
MHRSVNLRSVQKVTALTQRPNALRTNQTRIRGFSSIKSTKYSLPQTSNVVLKSSSVSTTSFALRVPFSVSRRTFATLPAHNKVGLPALSPTMEQGNIAKWRKKEGDKLKAGEVIAEIETDKATVDFEAAEDGYLAKIIHPAGTKDLRVGEVIAIVVENQSDIAAFKDFQAGAASTQAPVPPSEAQAPVTANAKPTPTPQPAAQPQTTPAQPNLNVVPGAPPPPGPLPKIGVFASPLAKATASQQGVPLQGIQGSGPSGRIVQQDVLQRAAQGVPSVQQVSVSVQQAGSFTDIPHTQIRKVIASRLSLSKQTIPHYYLTMDCRVDELLRLRTQFNDKANGAYKLSVNDFVVKAAAIACTRVPEANSSWSDDFVRRYHYVDINVAVNTDRGLLTPLIQDADKLGLAGISNAVKTLAEKGKDGKLSPSELSSGTFTISNLGMFGIKQFAAVINPPQACILAVGGSEKRVIVNENSKENPYSTANFMSVTLSCDHRVVDGAVGAKWLQVFKDLIEDPSKMLL